MKRVVVVHEDGRVLRTYLPGGLKIVVNWLSVSLRLPLALSSRFPPPLALLGGQPTLLLGHAGIMDHIANCLELGVDPK